MSEPELRSRMVAIEERLVAAEARVNELECWKLAADVNLGRLDDEIDIVDDSLTSAGHKMEARLNQRITSIEKPKTP